MRTPFVVGEAVRMSGGSWVIRRQPLYRPRVGLQRDTVDYFLVGPDMGRPERFARVAGALGGAYHVAGRGIRHGVAAFSPKALSAAYGKCVAITSTDVAEVLIVDAGGEVVGRFPYEGLPQDRPVTVEWKRAYVSWQAANPPPGVQPPDADEQRAMLEVDRFGETLPVSDGLFVDPLGYVWLQDYGVGGTSRTATVLEPSLDGSFRVELPEDARILDVGEDHILTVVTGIFGEHVVRRHALERTPSEHTPISRCFT